MLSRIPRYGYTSFFNCSLLQASGVYFHALPIVSQTAHEHVCAKGFLCESKIFIVLYSGARWLDHLVVFKALLTVFQNTVPFYISARNRE